MPDALAKPASVAVIPCYNEGRNPIELAATLRTVSELSMVFCDDGSEGASADALEELSRIDPARVRVVRGGVRRGKVATLLDAMRTLDPSIERVVFVDSDVQVPAATVRAAIDELERADLVLINAMALEHPRTFWEWGAIFSANRHARLRDAHFDRYPALCTNGRLLGMSRRLIEAILRSDVPRHTEDSHFMLVALANGYTYSYLRDAMLYFRAPDTLEDYLRQTNRFSEGRALLRERWSEEQLHRWYDPRPRDLLTSSIVQALHDPFGAFAFAVMIAAKLLQRSGARSQQAAWATSSSTKVLR